MATGDTVISIAVEGGVTKSVTLDSATRVLSRANVQGMMRPSTPMPSGRWLKSTNWLT